jgi:hypothetical protein
VFVRSETESKGDGIKALKVLHEHFNLTRKRHPISKKKPK